jgi:hypothetical protein
LTAASNPRFWFTKTKGVSLIHRAFLIPFLIAVVSCGVVAQNSQNGSTAQLCAFPAIATPGWYDWIYSPGVPSTARNSLLPLYQQLDQLQRLRLPVALLQVQDRASDFLAAAGKAVESNAPMLVKQSATGQSSPGNAATSAESPEALGWDIGSDIRNLENQIKTLRHEYGLDTTIGPAAKAIDISSAFSRKGLQNWLAKSDCGQKLLERTGIGATGNTASEPCSQFVQRALAANKAVDDCLRRLTLCFQPCGNPNLSTSAAGACIRACGSCDRETIDNGKATQDVLACRGGLHP